MSSSSLARAFATILPSLDKKVDDMLDPLRTSLSVVPDDLLSLALVNKVKALRRAFPTFITFPSSFAFEDCGPSMVWDAHTHTHSEPSTNEREQAMGFFTSTTTALGLSKC